MLVHSKGEFQDFLQLNEIGSQNCTCIMAAIPYAMQGVASEDFYETATRADIETTTFCRLDWSIPFDTRILQKYSSQSIRFFFIEEYLHAKVIWWKGWGAYVGSCNLTDRACFENYEAGYFIDQGAMQQSRFDQELTTFFDCLRHAAIEPSAEILALLLQQNDRLSDFRAMRHTLSQEFSRALHTVLDSKNPSR